MSKFISVLNEIIACFSLTFLFQKVKQSGKWKKSRETFENIFEKCLHFFAYLQCCRLGSCRNWTFWSDSDNFNGVRPQQNIWNHPCLKRTDGICFKKLYTHFFMLTKVIQGILLVSSNNIILYILYIYIIYIQYILYRAYILSFMSLKQDQLKHKQQT